MSLKDEIANHLITLLNGDKHILSIGSGIGYIEKQLYNHNNNFKIVAIEPGDCNNKWAGDKINLLNGFFPSALSGLYSNKDFDFVYASGIDYVFDDESYITFLSSLIEFGINDFLLTEIFVPSNRIKVLIKDYLKRTLSLIHVYNMGQFWGYLRTIDEHLQLLKIAGFTHFKIDRYKHGAYWIRARI